MRAQDLRLFPFALAGIARPVEGLEARVKRFLEEQPGTECLDAAAFAQTNGSGFKADDLLDGRSIVADLKTLNGDPTERLEQRLKSRFAEPGSPIVCGTVGLSAVFEKMPDAQALSKMAVDLSGRSVRRHLLKADEQIAATKARLAVPEAAGLAIILNDGEPLIDACVMGYALRTAFLRENAASYPNIDFVWVSTEVHRIRLPGGALAFPQLLVSRTAGKSEALDFMGRMMAHWATFHGGRAHLLEHNGEWDVLTPVYDDGPPALNAF